MQRSKLFAGVSVIAVLFVVFVYIKLSEVQNEIITLNTKQEHYEKIHTKSQSSSDLLKKDFKALHRDEQTEEHKNRTKVLVFTSKRSGSSFTGALFATNPDFLYMFEPLAVYRPGDITEEFDTTNIDCWDEPLACPLNYLYDCQIRKYFDIAAQMNPGPKGDENRLKWYHRIFYKTEHELNMSASSGPIDDVCQHNYSHMAAKIIRGKYIESVVDLMRNGVKVLFLIRDPRGLINSRRTFGKSVSMSHDKMIAMMDTECTKNRENIEFILKAYKDPELRELFEENFRIIRYDDISANMSYFAAKLYKYFGIEMPSIVERWVKVNPKITVWLLPKEKYLYQTPQPPRGSIHLEKWQTGLDFETVQGVQEVCKYTMNKLGYNMLKSLDQMEKPFKPLLKVPEDLPFQMT